MLSKWQFNLLTALGVAAVLLVLANSTLFMLNRHAQEALNQRQQFIQQTIPLEGLYRDIVKALAELGVKANDQQLLGVLSAQGLSVKVNGAATKPVEAPARKGEKEK
jgi:type VI protein secretion system component VasK